MKGGRDLFHELRPPTVTGSDSIARREFVGASSPRYLRAIDALRRRPMSREALDREAGCSNGPDLVRRLRERGLDVPCHRVPVLDRDGRWVERGVYMLTAEDRRKVERWLRLRAEAAR
ncbi:MAG: hypothetical protein WCK28_00690 [Burkholderiales bacterium]